MTDSETVASQAVVRKRGFARALTFGAMAATAAFMLQNANFNPQHQSFAYRPILMIGDPTPPMPSAYDAESGMSRSQLLNRWDAVITEASQRFNIPKAWIRAVMQRESGGRTMLGEDRPIVSRAGAMGLMQMMPDTYRQMSARHELGDNPFEPRDNIMAGAAYLHWLHERYGYPRMFAAYNAGPARLERGGRLPAETRAYVGGITRVLKVSGSRSDLDLVRLTRPDGATVKVDPARVTAIRAPLPGEYAPAVKAVLTLGRHKRQGIREDVQMARAAIRADGGLI